MTDDQYREPLVSHLDVGAGAKVVIVNKLIGDIHTEIKAPTTQDDRNRLAMLKRVRTEWIDGVLRQSLYRVARIELQLETRENIVDLPWSTIVQVADRVPVAIPSGTDIAQVFDSLNQAILILGAPGTGKTTLLLELADALIERALQDQTHPIPAVFNLSTWAVKREPLRKWLVSELQQKERVPKKVAQRWIDNGEMLPLLDGLDEVAVSYRRACLEAIHEFRNEFGLLPIAVCSRTSDFEALDVRGRFHGAVEVQHLSKKQVDEYLGRSPQLVSLRSAIAQDSALAELVETPLMLWVTMLAHREIPVDIVNEQNLEQKRRRLFESFVNAMFKRRAVELRYAEVDTLHFLSWLGSMLQERQESIFYLETLQHDWLPTRQQLFFGIAILIGCGLVCGLAFILIDLFFCLLVHAPLKLFPRVILLGLRGGMVLGIVIGLLGFLFKSKPADKIQLRFGDVRWRLRSAVRKGLLTGVLSTLAFIAFGLMVRLSAGTRNTVTGGLFVGIVLGSLIGIVTLLTTEKIESRRSPNQGTHDSVKNAFVIYLLCWLFFGLPLGLFFWRFGGAIHTGYLPHIVKHIGLVRTGLLLGVGMGGFLGLFAGLFGGGMYAIKHFVLRLFMWGNRSSPLNYVAFLNYASERLFLRRLGAGYIFTHRMFMDYFASLRDRKKSAPQPSTSTSA